MDIVILNRDLGEAINILAKISKTYKECRITYISNNEKDFREFIQINPFDIVIFEEYFLDKVPEILNYKVNKICLVDKYRQCKRYKAVSKNSERALLDNIGKIITKKSLTNQKVRELIRKELEGLGYNFSLVGTQYLEEAINLIYMKDCELNLEREVYAQLSKSHKKSVHTVKVNILNSTNAMLDYFGYNNVFEYLGIEPGYGIGTKAIICAVLNKIDTYKE